MNYRIIATTFLYSYLLLFAACDFSDQNQLVEGSGGGIGGTGIAIGRINAFGSIIVNGIEFDTDNAMFVRDNQTVSGQIDYAVGERVTITGLIDPKNNMGTANKVVFSDLIEGPVTAKPTLLSSDIEVMGQTVHTNNLTVLHGFLLLSDLVITDMLEVSGFTDANGIIQASSIKLRQEIIDTFEVKGKISNLDLFNQTFSFNKLTIDYSNLDLNEVSDALVEGKNVRVIGSMFMNNILFATTITEEIVGSFPSGAKIEVEGVITRFNSVSDFDLNNQAVTTIASTVFEDGAISNLGLNVEIEIEGEGGENGILIASSIEFKQTEDLLKIEAVIDAIDIENKTLVLFGKLIQIDQATILFDESSQNIRQLSFSQLLVGEYVDAKFQKQDDGSLLAIRLSREDEEKLLGTDITEIGLKGTVQDIDEVTGSFTLFGIQMISNENTVYRNKKEQIINKTILFSSIQPDITLVEIEGENIGNNTVLMHSLLIDLTP